MVLSHSIMIQVMFGAANNWPMGAALSILTMLIVMVVSFTFVGLMRFIGGRIR